MLPGSVLLCPRPVPGLLGWACLEQLGLSSTACGLMLGDSICPLHKWGLAPSPNCKCGASEQTADHVLTACRIHRAPHGARGLVVLDDETRWWFNNTIYESSAIWGSKRINPRPQSCLCLTWSECPSNDDDDDIYQTD